MTNRKPILVILTLGVAIGSFFITRSVRAKPSKPGSSAPSDVVLDWLNVPAGKRPEIRQHDPAFASDLQRLRTDLAARRSELVAALERTDTPDPEIRQRSEAVIAANSGLERRVTDHLLTIRHHLAPDQQKKLFDLCAEGVRQGCGWRWRAGQGACTQPDGQGEGRGQGRGQGGPGRGGRRTVPPASLPGQQDVPAL